MLMFAEVLLLSVSGPAWLIPDLAPAALSAADDLAGSRIELLDPYVVVLPLAGLAVLLLVVACVAQAGGRVTYPFLSSPAKPQAR